MTVIEMNEVLGKVLNDIQNKDLTPHEREVVFQRAEYTAKIAKQVINGADVTLRTDKLCNRHDRIDKLVGE